MKRLIKVRVGSHAHGLAGPNSDVDHRGVFVQPTSELLKIGGTSQQTSWVEGTVDDVSWEVGKFLFLAQKCNPSILECFLAPRVMHVPVWDVNILGEKEEHLEPFIARPGEERRSEISKEDRFGTELRDLFPYLWSSKGIRNAFVGYGLNQRKNFLKDPQGVRGPKYAAAYLRTLYNGWELLTTGAFTINVGSTPFGKVVSRFKEGNYSGPGEVIEYCYEWQQHLERAYTDNPNKETDLEPVNEFLLKIRKEYWT